MHCAAPLGVLGDIKGLAVTEVLTVGEVPHSSLHSSNHFRTVQIFRTLEAICSQGSLHLLQRNIGVGVGDDGTDVGSFFLGIVVAVFQVHTLIVDAIIITGNGIAAIQNFVIAFIKGIPAIGGPGIVLIGINHNQGLGNVVVDTAIGADHMVAHFVCTVGVLVNRQVVIAVIAGGYFNRDLIAVPNGFNDFFRGFFGRDLLIGKSSRRNQADAHHRCQRCRQQSFQGLLHIVSSLIYPKVGIACLCPYHTPHRLQIRLHI